MEAVVRRIFVLPVLAVILSVMVTAQQPKPKTFTNADVIKMAKAGLDDSTIVLAIQQHPAQYDTSADALVELKTQGVSQAVINAMLTAGKGGAPAAPGGSAAAGPAAGKWHKVENKNAFDDSKTVSFLVDAEGAIDGPVTSKVPTLIVRCKEDIPEAYISTGMAASVEEGTDDHHVRLRFDSEAPTVEAWAESTNNEALFAPHSVEFIKQLVGAKKLAFGFTPFDANPQVAIFDVEGLGHLLAGQDVCAWDATYSSYK
jgi:type VI secretion system protein VasI